MPSLGWCRKPQDGLVHRELRAHRAIECPRILTSSTSRLKRVPPHTSQGTKTSARKTISTCTAPAPWHSSQRPPGMLKEKVAGV